MVCIILFSLYFYYKSSAECCFILLGVCLSDYLLGIILGNVRNRILRRCIVAVNVIVNIGMLVYFKYLNLIFSTFASIGGTDFDALDIILPAGISFFTFRSISYIPRHIASRHQSARLYIFPHILSSVAGRAGCESSRHVAAD